MAAMFVSSPSDTIADIAAKVSDVKKEEKDGMVIFTGTLTEKGIESLGAGGGMLAGRGAGAGDAGGPQMESTGTFRIEIKDGKIAALHFETKRSGSFGDRGDFKSTMSQHTRIEKVGETKYEVPADALALFK